LQGGTTSIAAERRFRLTNNGLARCCAFTILIIATTLTTTPVRLHAAIITGAGIARQDAVTELHLAVRGRGLGWHLTTHGQQLWINLDHARLELPHPLISGVAPPITSVQALDDGGGIARIVVEVSGRDDYAIARMPHELVLRVAPAGTAADLAEPLIMRPAHRQTPFRSVENRTWPLAPTPAMTVQRRASNDRPAIAPPLSERSAGLAPTTAAMIPGVTLGAAPAAAPHHSELAAYSYARPSQQPATLPDAISSSSGDQATAPLVVIDPGHGGYDPGTAAADGTNEKDVALAIAVRVAAALKAEGVRAELTRDHDTFLSLADRTAMANQAGADLFVSIHMNSSPNAEVSGIETYYLNNTTDHATIRLARMENGVSGGYSLSGSPDLNYILTDMRQQYKANDAASLAQMIEGETSHAVAASMGLQLAALGALQGPFYVLVGAMMPAVLVECGFLSNADEARLLETPAYQQAIASGIGHAVADYFKSSAPVGNL
jgi:N-acetylmuramoyl-L-alanine amidase